MKYPLSKIMGAGLLVGTLDITAACLQYFIKTGKGPAVVLKYIVSALVGKSAFDGGTGIIITGLLLHYLVAVIFTFFFFLVAGPFLFSVLKRKVLVGFVYGIFVWCVMNLIVVPLSAIHTFPSSLENSLVGAAILIVCIGMPLAFITAGRFKKQP